MACTKVLFHFRWDSVSAGAPLKTMPGSASCCVCTMCSLLLCHLGPSEIERNLLFSSSSLLGKRLFFFNELTRIGRHWYPRPPCEVAPLSVLNVVCFVWLSLPTKHDLCPCHAGSLGTCVGHWVSRSVSGQCAPPENWVRQNTSVAEGTVAEAVQRKGSWWVLESSFAERKTK